MITSHTVRDFMVLILNMRICEFWMLKCLAWIWMAIAFTIGTDRHNLILLCPPYLQRDKHINEWAQLHLNSGTAVVFRIWHLLTESLGERVERIQKKPLPLPVRKLIQKSCNEPQSTHSASWVHCRVAAPDLVGLLASETCHFILPWCWSSVSPGRNGALGQMIWGRESILNSGLNPAT